MPPLKLILNDTLEYDFNIIAIHCSLEDYRIAFTLNKYLGLRLNRKSTDVDFRQDNQEALFSLFTFEDLRNYRSYTLVGNRCKIRNLDIVNNDGLFKMQENFKTLFLVPELPKADFLLKLESDTPIPKTMLASINSIPQVVTAYAIDVNQLKSKRNLIFE
ncbi:MAG: IPExxxVDY family protein [Leeuwenhoekiella sp.]